jgi:hypothetical protein
LTVEDPPTVSISAPATGAVFTVGQVVNTNFACADGAGSPGVTVCVDSNGASGGSGRLDNSTPGQHTYAVTTISTDGCPLPQASHTP